MNLAITRFLFFLAVLAIVIAALLLWFHRITGSDAAVFLGITTSIGGTFSGVLRGSDHQAPPPAGDDKP